MSFLRKNANLVPIVDTVFAVVDKANNAKSKYGKENVIDATIGSLYDEQNQLVAYDIVYNIYNQLDNKIKAKYASSFIGNDNFRTQVKNWVFQGETINLATEVIATPGGTGAISSVIYNVLESEETIVLPNIAWGSYKLMAQERNIKVAQYEMFDEGKFNLASFKDVCTKVMEKQHKLLVIINDPCHNPTGYSLTHFEWQEIISFTNKLSQLGPVTILNDIAYIDYSYDIEASRKYLNLFNDISSNTLIAIAFSCSKTMTAYGLRCGALVLMAQNQEDINSCKIVLEKNARALWSNIPNAPMETFSLLTTRYLTDFKKEKEKYIELLNKRSSIFIKEANQVGLKIYPYKEGFFVTVACENNKIRDILHERLMDNNIFTVAVNLGIRIAICSLSLEAVTGLAARIKNIADQIQ